MSLALMAALVFVMMVLRVLLEGGGTGAALLGGLGAIGLLCYFY